MSEDPIIEGAPRPRSAEAGAAFVVGLLRQAANELEALMQLPSQPGDGHHVAAALHAVHRALIELGQLANRIVAEGDSRLTPPKH